MSLILHEKEGWPTPPWPTTITSNEDNPRQMSEIGRTMHFDRHHINEIHSNCRAQLAGMGAQIKIELRWDEPIYWSGNDINFYLKSQRNIWWPSTKIWNLNCTSTQTPVVEREIGEARGECRWWWVVSGGIPRRVVRCSWNPGRKREKTRESRRLLCIVLPLPLLNWRPTCVGIRCTTSERDIYVFASSFWIPNKLKCWKLEHVESSLSQPLGSTFFGCKIGRLPLKPNTASLQHDLVILACLWGPWNLGHTITRRV